MVVGGFLVNRLNVSLTGLEATSGVRYVPSWMEVAITMSIVVVGMIAFRYATQYLPVFHSAKPESVKEDSRSPVYAQS